MMLGSCATCLMLIRLESVMKICIELGKELLNHTNEAIIYLQFLCVAAIRMTPTHPAVLPTIAHLYAKRRPKNIRWSD